VGVRVLNVVGVVVVVVHGGCDGVSPSTRVLYYEIFRSVAYAVYDFDDLEVCGCTFSLRMNYCVRNYFQNF